MNLVAIRTPTPEVAEGNTRWDVVPVAQTPEDGMHSKKWAVVFFTGWRNPRSSIFTQPIEAEVRSHIHLLYIS